MGQVTDMRAEVTQDDNKGREEPAGTQGRAAGQMLRVGLAQPNGKDLHTSPSCSFYREGTERPDVAWHQGAWLTGRGKSGLHRRQGGLSLDSVTGWESRASKKGEWGVRLCWIG